MNNQNNAIFELLKSKKNGNTYGKFSFICDDGIYSCTCFPTRLEIATLKRNLQKTSINEIYSQDLKANEL